MRKPKKPHKTVKQLMRDAREKFIADAEREGRIKELKLILEHTTAFGFLSTQDIRIRIQKLTKTGG